MPFGQLAISAAEITIMEENTVSKKMERERLYVLSKEMKVEELS